MEASTSLGGGQSKSSSLTHDTSPELVFSGPHGSDLNAQHGDHCAGSRRSSKMRSSPREVFSLYDPKRSGKMRVADMPGLLASLGRASELTASVMQRLQETAGVQDITYSAEGAELIPLLNIIDLLKEVEEGKSQVDVSSKQRLEQSQSAEKRLHVLKCYGMPKARIDKVPPIGSKPSPPKASRLGAEPNLPYLKSFSVGSLGAPSAFKAPRQRELSVGELRGIIRTPLASVDDVNEEPLTMQSGSRQRRRNRGREHAVSQQSAESDRSTAVAATPVEDTDLIKDQDIDNYSETSSVRRDNDRPKGLGEQQGAHGQQGKKRDPNPFVEFEDREQRVLRERRWLQDDPQHLNLRTRELVHDSTMTRLQIDAKDPEEAYEDAVYHGSYSLQVRALVALRNEMKRIRYESEGSNTPGSYSEARKALSTSLPQIKKQAKSGQFSSTQEPVRPTKRSERNATVACVRSLKSMQERLKTSFYWEEPDKAAPPPKQDEMFTMLQTLKLGFGNNRRNSGSPP